METKPWPPRLRHDHPHDPRRCAAIRLLWLAQPGPWQGHRRRRLRRIVTGLWAGQL